MSADCMCLVTALQCKGREMIVVSSGRVAAGLLALMFVLLTGPAAVSADEPNLEQDVSFLLGEERIAGTLVKPAHAARPPVVLILPGTSGRRDGPPISGDGRGLFRRTAQLWAENGIASLRISTRGRGGSDGLFEDMTLERRIEEAQGAVDWLSDRDDLDGSRISVLGHSQGTIVAAALAGRLDQGQRIQSVVLWAPVADPLASYRRSMGALTLEKGLHAGPDEIVRWRGAGGTMRAFKTGFFRGLLTINTLAEIEPYRGRLLIVTGRRDAWSRTADAQVFRGHGSGEVSFVEFDVGHRMGASEGVAAVDEVAGYVMDWLKAE